MYSRGTPRRVIVAFFGAAAAIALVLEWARRALPAVRAAFNGLFGPLLKDQERSGITGATWLAVAGLAVVVVLRRDAAVAALWCATAGDPAASLAGRAWHSRRPAKASAGKTHVGSAACFATSLAGVYAIAGVAIGPAVAVALAATIAERLPIAPDDNVRIALTAGVTAWLAT